MPQRGVWGAIRHQGEVVALPKIKFNGLKFSKEFVGRRACHWLANLFEGMGLRARDFAYLIDGDKRLVDFIPPEQIARWKGQANAHKQYSKLFTDDDIYSWIPAESRAIIELHPGGWKWAYRQIEFIRQLFFSS